MGALKNVLMKCVMQCAIVFEFWCSVPSLQIVLLKFEEDGNVNVFKVYCYL